MSAIYCNDGELCKSSGCTMNNRKCEYRDREEGMSYDMSGQSTDYDPACDKCGGDPALCKCYETEDERMSDKIGVCKDGGKCGIGGYCDDCHSVPAETEFEGYPGITHDFESAKQRITEIEKQLAERDEALARCVEALKAAEAAIMDEVCASSGEDHPVINAHAKIAEKARKVLASLPTYAQATAKVLAAARELCKFTTYEPDGSWPELNRLREAVREEQEGK